MEVIDIEGQSFYVTKQRTLEDESGRSKLTLAPCRGVGVYTVLRNTCGSFSELTQIVCHRVAVQRQKGKKDRAGG
jgi:hypothetical protein